jgi:hypothetical protein
MRIKPRRGSWILAVLFGIAVSFPQIQASASQNGEVIFGYEQGTISQEVGVSTAEKSELTFTVSAAETQDWKPSSDLLNIGIALYGTGGGLIYQHSTGNIAIDSGQFSNYSISVSESGVGAGGWSAVASARAFIIGQDGEFWAGNYGTRVESASLKFNDNVELLSNTEFTSTDSWTSTIGWQTCSGGSGNKPCVSISVPITTTTTTIPANNSQYSLGDDMVWGIANEGENLLLSAPGGGVFTEVIFASYGNPSGDNDAYTQNWCHATNSIQKVSEIFIGNSSGTIDASNGVFGDPCGGTYKNLRVVLKYTGGLPNTTTTTTIPETTTTTTTTTTIPEITTTEPETTTTEPETTTTEPSVVPPPVETIPTENTTVSIPELDSTPVSTPETETTTVTIPEQDTTPVSTPDIDTTPITNPDDDNSPVETVPEVTVPEITQDTADQAVEDIFKDTDNPEELGAAVTDALADAESPAEVAALVTSLLDNPLSTEEFAAVVESVFADDLSTAELSAALDAVFSEPISDEKFAEVIDAVLDSPLTDEQFAEVVEILESDNVTEEQVSTAVDNILENGITEDQATELATSEKVLESIDGDQAADIFEEIPVSDLTEEEEAALVEAVTDAPEEVKNAFEETIDVYAAGLDDYVAVGSNIDVGSRRTLLAATTAMASVTVAAAGSTGGSGGGNGSGSGGGNGSGSGSNNNSARREEEQEDEEEESAEIEGPEGDEEENNFTRNSIFKYQEGTMKRTFSPWGFVKKFAKETAALAFTISGTVIVFATLSGDTRKITLIATSVAFAVHYINAMLQNDE